MLDAFKRVASGEGREVVLISGEAGLGKTTLVAETARAASDGGACVLFGHCEEDLATPYQLFTEALGHYVTHAPEEQLVADVEEHGSELGRLVPALATRLPGLPPSKATDADAERYQLFAAVVGLLVQVSQHQPVVLVLDDLQWADTASLQLLGHVTAADRPMRLLVLGTYRDSELSRAHPLLETLAALHRHHGVTRIELTGLDDTGVVSLMEAAAGHTLDDAAVGLAHALYRETDGNPFFVSEVLRHLSETGAISQDATGRWTAADTLEQIALPDSVRMVIGARVGRLGQHAEQVLSVAAVIGRDFDLDVLAQATKTSEDELLDILDAAAAVSLVRELADTPGHYTFAHALIQHTLYADLGLTRRARAHRQRGRGVGGPLRRPPRVPPRRTGPPLAGFPTHRPGQGPQLLPPGGRRRARGPRPRRRPPLLRPGPRPLRAVRQRRSDPGHRPGHRARHLPNARRETPPIADTLLDAARRAADLGDTDRLVAAALANNRGIFSNAGTIDADKVEILEMALERLSPDDSDRALVLATLCIGADFREPARASPGAGRRGPRHRRILRRRRHHRAGPQPSLRTRSACRPLLEQTLARSADALRRAERVGDPVLLFWAALQHLGNAARAGDIDEMDRCLEIVGSLAEQLDQPMLALGAHLRAGPASADRREHRTGRTTGHRGTPDRQRRAANPTPS